MALSDRDYMRDNYHAPHIATKLIIFLIVAFVVESVLIFYGHIDVIGELGLTVAGLKAGKVWQLLTFQFLHAAPWPWHVLLNCVGLYFFGRPVEEAFGAKKFIILYLSCGILGGLLQALTSLLLPNHPDVPVVGASAGICGMIAIYCSLHPMQELTTWIYFFPVHVRAMYLLIFLIALSVFGTLVPFDNVAHAAHLGGILLGIAYVHWGVNASPFFSKWNLFKPHDNSSANKKPAWRPARKTDDSSAEEFLQREVDPILEKISAHGIQSLTKREREILEKARAKMAKR